MKLDWRGALGIAVSVALLAYALRHESPADIWRVIVASNAGLLLLATVVATLVFPLRALRWRVILEPLGEPSLRNLWRATAIGMMVNNVVPARAGELARAFALARTEPGIRFTAALASLVVDRIIDGVVVVTLLGVAMALSPFPADTTIMGQPVARLAIVTGAIAVGALVVLGGLALFPARVIALFDAVVGRVIPRFHPRLRPFFLTFVDGLGALRSPGRLARILAWAFALWLTNALAFWIAFLAVGIDVPFTAALFVQGLVAFAVAAPSAPGFFGVFEVSAVVGLALYAIPGDLAVSWALGFHILTFIPITLIGLFYFGQLGLHFRDLGSANSREGTT
jgi:uncharacterized protein (TIRG00374 family)